MKFNPSKSHSETLCFDTQIKFVRQEFAAWLHVVPLPGTGGTVKKLEDMNLVDDFLAHSLTILPEEVNLWN